MKVSSYGRLPRRIGSKVLLAGLVLSPLVTHSGDTRASSPASAVGSTVSPLVGLGRGMAGPNVKTLQKMLADAGFRPVGGADGYFGRATEKSLKDFQQSEGLSPSGVADSITVAKLSNSPLPDATEKDGESGSTEKSETSEESEAPVLSPEVAELIGVSKGSVGSAAKAVQQLLIDAGVRLRGGADGVFGRVSEGALKAYQKDHGLDQTGVADEATLLALTGSAVAVPSEYVQLVGLRPGALGDSVAALQRRLLDLGITVRGGADGVFGPATAQSLKLFQDQRGLEKTGIVDEVTALALSKDSSGGESYGSTTGYGVYGESGSRVLSLQTALTQAGITLRGGPDGWFGSATSAAIMKFQRREGLQVTGVVNNATAELLDLEKAPAPSNSPVANIALEAFPIQGFCGYQDGWHDPRPGGRLHVGVDIIAPEGKLLYAVADGTITRIYRDFPGSMPGNGLRLTMADGTYFFYAHLLSFAEGIDVGSKVSAGQVIGRNGNTGSSGTAHLHFEIHPNGGAAINPYPIVKAIDGCSVTEPIAVTLKD